MVGQAFFNVANILIYPHRLHPFFVPHRKGSDGPSIILFTTRASQQVYNIFSSKGGKVLHRIHAIGDCGFEFISLFAATRITHTA